MKVNRASSCSLHTQHGKVRFLLKPSEALCRSVSLPQFTTPSPLPQEETDNYPGNSRSFPLSHDPLHTPALLSVGSFRVASSLGAQRNRSAYSVDSLNQPVKQEEWQTDLSENQQRKPDATAAAAETEVFRGAGNRDSRGAEPRDPLGRD